MPRDMKLVQAPVDVGAAELRAAAARLPRMKRAPAGARGQMPRDTILSPDADGMTVETPMVSSLVPSRPAWQVVVSVDAWRLLEVCDRFKSIGAYKSPDDVFRLSVRDGELRVAFRTTTVSLPIL